MLTDFQCTSALCLTCFFPPILKWGDIEVDKGREEINWDMKSLSVMWIGYNTFISGALLIVPGPRSICGNS